MQFKSQLHDSSLRRLIQHLHNKYLEGIADIQTAYGGDTARSYRITDLKGKHLFLKVSHAQHADMFTQEQHNIHTIRQLSGIIIPNSLGFGQFEQSSYLLLEYIAMQPKGNEQKLGAQLAQMHQHKAPARPGLYGFANNNYIGSHIQKNSWSHSWADFWLTQRLKPQLELSYHQGFTLFKTLENRLLQAVSNVLEHHQPKPCLLHGDLWSGNKAFTDTGEPVIFDPACYYGDRETDIAMTELFGGFSADFYRAYTHHYPLHTHYEQRKTIYNLYHQLNHLNLFGDSYLNSCTQAIKTIIKHN